MTVVTRFAPSPTGFLHIGGARTALFNWLFAQRHGGRYLLRIEDTDRARSTQAAIDAILDGLSWLGLASDVDPVYQFARAGRHREVSEAMVARGTAFRCYVSAEELEQQRANATAAREALSAAKKAEAPADEIAKLQSQVETLTRAFRSPYRDGLKPPSPDAPYVIRLRAPDTGTVLNDDLVQGIVVIPAVDIDDLVLLRADGTPTYMLAVVVDDHDMGITHVIRGDDHLTNAARQIPIFQAMGWDVPRYAHVPLIHGPDGAKLSKRHGALGAEAYRDMGYLPEGMNSYLMRLGWSPGAEEEILSKEEAAPIFDLAAVGKNPARLDFDKLAHVNAHFLHLADDKRLTGLTLDYIQARPENDPKWASRPRQLDDTTKARVAQAVPVLKARAKTVADLADQAYFLMRTRPFKLDAQGEKLMKDDTLARLRRLEARLKGASPWDVETLSAVIQGFAQDEGVGLGQIGPALRAVLTGGAPAPDLGATLAFLGREEALARLEDRLNA